MRQEVNQLGSGGLPFDPLHTSEAATGQPCAGAWHHSLRGAFPKLVRLAAAPHLAES